MSPSSTVHGGRHDTKYVTFELQLHAALVADEIRGYMLQPARRGARVLAAAAAATGPATGEAKT